MNRFLVSAPDVQLFDNLLDLFDLLFALSNDPVPPFDHRFSLDPCYVRHRSLIQEADGKHRLPDAFVLPTRLLHLREHL